MMRSNKTATLQARLDPSLKKKGDIILKKIGITASQAVNAMYAQIVLQNGLPFDLKIPNKKTIQAIEELESGGGKSFSSFNEMMDDVEE